MTLPSDYTPLTIAEVFYMATMGGAQGTYQTTRVHEPSQVVCIIRRIKYTYSELLVYMLQKWYCFVSK